MAKPSTDDIRDRVSVRIDRDASAFIVAVEGDVEALLGWSSEQLIGRPSTDFIHPSDQPSAIRMWMTMIDTPGRPFTWRGRYRDRDGRWTWVETVNTNRLHDVGNGFVMTLMHRVDSGDLSVEEQLRAQGQLLHQLADALPVGLVHFTIDGTVISTNRRLEAILGRSSCHAVDELFGDLAAVDRTRFDEARDRVVSGGVVDGIEVQVGASAAPPLVCSLSMRPLTDAAGDIVAVIATVDDVTEQVRVRRQLEYRAGTDELTGCLSRSAIFDELDRHLAADESQSGVAVAYIDLDEFKKINDVHGHACGDEVLASFGQRLRREIRDHDVVGRVGGDEFLVVCTQVQGEAGAARLKHRLTRAARVALDVAGDHILVEASVGVAYTSTPADADELVARADSFMYEAKARHRQGLSEDRTIRA